jgi:hypothetical protein
LKEFTSNIKCKPLEQPCLFNIDADPCEHYNLAEKFPHILDSLVLRLEELNKTAIPAGNLPLDPRADPRFWDHTWTNFGDYSLMQNSVDSFHMSIHGLH